MSEKFNSKKYESKPEMDVMNFIKKVLENPEKEIKEEFDRTKNDWYSCYFSILNSIGLALNFPSINKYFSEEEIEKTNEKIQNLREEVQKLRKQYPGRGENIPSQEIRDNLMKELKEIIKLDV